MRSAIFTIALLCVFMKGTAQTPSAKANTFNPLSVFSKEWDAPKFKSCFTAANTRYFSQVEKDIIHIINLARADPRLFAETIVKKYPEHIGKENLPGNWYYDSLLDTMMKMSPMPIAVPDSLAYVSALCHAASSGKKSHVGHDRVTEECKEKTRYASECVFYGSTASALVIVMELLIDEGVPSLGHRDNLLSNFSRIGVSRQPHGYYKFNTVIDQRW